MAPASFQRGEVMKYLRLFDGVSAAPLCTIFILLFSALARIFSAKNISLFLAALFLAARALAGGVLPVPQVLVTDSIAPRVIDAGWNIAVDTSDPKQLFNANYLRSSLITEFSLTLNVVDLSTRTSGGKYILLGKVNNSALSSFLNDRQLVLDPRVGAEGYLLKVFADDQVLIAANSDAGVFYGIQSLLHVKPDTTSAFQLLYILNGQVEIDGVTIQDWPDKPVRGMYLSNDRCASSSYYTTNPGACSYENYMLFVEKMARMKMNFVVTGSREPILGTDYYALLGLFARARELYITPVPTPQGMAQAADFISSNPRIAEGIPAITEPFVVVRSGDNLILSPENQVDRTGELTNADMEVEVTTWSSTNPESGWYFAPITVTCAASDTSCTEGSPKTVIHWTWDRTYAHDGISSLKIDVPQSWATNYPGSFSSPVYIRKWLPVESKKTYTLSFWVKTDAISGNAPQILVVQYDGTGTRAVGSDGSVNSAYLATGTYGWRQYFLSVPTTPTTTYLSVSARLQPGGYGRLWLDDFELRRMDGALTNVIRTALTDIAVSSVDGSMAYMEGSDYTVSNGVMQFNTNANGSNYRFYPLNTPSMIGIPANSRLHEGDHVLLSYDYALKVDSEASANWTHCYSANEPDTYDKYVYPYIERLMSELGSDAVFYSGSDEIRGINRDRRNQGKSNAQLIGEDLNRIYQRVKQANPDALFFAWDDMVDPWHNGGNEYYQFKYGGAKGASEPFPSADASLPRATDFLPRKDFLHVIWWYGAADSLGIMANAPGYFESKGFEWIASPYDNSENILAWGRAIAGRPMNKGLIGTAWSSFAGFPLSANVAWNNLQKTQPSADVNTTGIDLLPTGFSAYKGDQNRVVVSETVNNQGNQAAGDSVIRYYLSINPTYESTDIALASGPDNGSTDCTKTIPAIGAGASITDPPLVCYAPAAISTGVPYYVLAVIDAANAVAEYNESNNGIASAGTLQW